MTDSIDTTPVRAGARDEITGEILTVALGQAAQDAITRVMVTCRPQMIAALAPFGLHPNDIQPTYRKVVYPEKRDA